MKVIENRVYCPTCGKSHFIFSKEAETPFSCDSVNKHILNLEFKYLNKSDQVSIIRLYCDICKEDSTIEFEI